MSKAYEMISESLTEIIEDLEKNDGKNLSITKGILQGLEEAAKDAQGLEVEGLKKTSIYREQKISKKIREQSNEKIFEQIMNF